MDKQTAGFRVMTIYSRKRNIKVLFPYSSCLHIGFFQYPKKEFRKEGCSFSPLCAMAKNNPRTCLTGSCEEHK